MIMVTGFKTHEYLVCIVMSIMVKEDDDNFIFLEKSTQTNTFNSHKRKIDKKNPQRSPVLLYVGKKTLNLVF